MRWPAIFLQDLIRISEAFNVFPNRFSTETNDPLGASDINSPYSTSWKGPLREGSITINFACSWPCFTYHSQPDSQTDLFLLWILCLRNRKGNIHSTTLPSPPPSSRFRGRGGVLICSPPVLCKHVCNTTLLKGTTLQVRILSSASTVMHRILNTTLYGLLATRKRKKFTDSRCCTRIWFQTFRKVLNISRVLEVFNWAMLHQNKNIYRLPDTKCY